MLSRKLGMVALFAMSALGAACGRLRPGSGPAPALIVFHNDGIDQAAVYITATGVEFRRIGTVFPGRTDTLKVPADLAQRGTVNIVASVFSRNMVPSTGPVSMTPGDIYEVRLSTDGRMLSFLPGR